MNRIRVLLLAALALTATFALAEGRKYAVLVGVSAYKDPGSTNLVTFPQLQYAHLDAQRLSTRLKELGWTVIEKTSEPGGKDEAGKASILGTLKSLVTTSEDTFLFFYSGNGCESAGTGYLACSDSVLQAPTDSRPGRPMADSMLSLGEVGQALTTMSTKKRILLLDISRKDRPMVMPDGSGPTAMRGDLVAEIARMGRSGPTSWCLLSSCDRGEESFEAPDLMGGKGGGVFTSALLDALSAPQSRDNAGRIRPDLCFDTVVTQVTTWCLANGRKMTPRWQADMMEPLDFGTVK
ncbi:MAG: caspase family protein [bacterium]